MRHETAEKKIRGLQKEFLTRIEAHPSFHELPPDLFNLIRRRVFRGTFEAYRLGVVGLDGLGKNNGLYAYFFGWVDDAAQHLNPAMHKQVVEMCFGTALEAYRVGAMFAATRFMEAA
jgi:hypothetical protein